MFRALSDRLAVGALAVGLAGAAASANVIRYQFTGLGLVAVPDGGFGDLDGAPNRIRTNFDVVVAGAGYSYRARGTLLGIADPPFSTNATTRLLNVKIENTMGNVGGQVFTFSHTFSPLGPGAPGTSAQLSGHFDSVTMPGWLGGGLIDAWSSVTGLGGVTVGLGGGSTGNVSGAAPIPFAFAGGPGFVAHPLRHNASMLFYLDSKGDAILMDSREGWQIRTMGMIPAPGSLGLLGLAVLALRRRR